MTNERHERVLAFGIISAVFLAVLLPEVGYVPIWDGRVYTDCVLSAAAKGLSMESLRCAGHPSQAWAVLLALPQLLRFGDVGVLHLTDALLGLLALGAIRVALSQVFPDRALARELDLLTLACAVHPVVLSTLLQVNVDFGVYVFFFAALAAVLSQRFGLAALAGLFLCFSKETGVLAYGLVVGLDAAFRILRGEEGWPARLRRVVPMWPTVIPVAAFVVHVLRWNSSHREAAIWKHAWQKGMLDGFNFFDLSDPIFVSYAAGICLLGFMWVVTALIAADLLVGGARMVKRRARRDVPGADRRKLAYVAALTLVLAYVLTAFRTWSNLRYFALLYPLLLFLGYAALLRIRARPGIRVSSLALAACLFLLSAYRSVDPVSRAVYGTFDIGERQMYRMTSITGEFNGPGRDELVYNLQFTGFHHVQNAFYRKIRPTGATVIAAPREVRWMIWSPLDARTFQRTLRPAVAITPMYSDDAGLAARGYPHEAWYLEFSNHAYDDTSLQRLLEKAYRDAEVVRVHAAGHVLKAHHLVRREARVLP